MIIPVRALNDLGIARFASWLDSPEGDPPKELLADGSVSEVVDGGYMIDTSREFATSYDLGLYLAREVFNVPGDRLVLLANAGMWSWISLLFIESLLAKKKKPARPLAKPHYIMQSPRLAYRLIARTAWDLVSLHGESAKVALGSSRSPWGDMAEQMTSRQEIYSHRSFWPVACALYAMPDGSIKRGTTTQRRKEARRDPKSKVGLGSVQRLPFTFRQFERTYNLRQMTGDQIVALLPDEYRKWRQP